MTTNELYDRAKAHVRSQIEGMSISVSGGETIVTLPEEQLTAIVWGFAHPYATGETLPED